MIALAVHAPAALGEIAGCFAFWAWLRLVWSSVWILSGVLSLAVFAFLLTRIDISLSLAGRAFVTCGGVYIAAIVVRGSQEPPHRPVPI